MNTNPLSDEVIGKCIDTSKYTELMESIPDKLIELIELIDPKEFSELYDKYKPYLEGVEAYPIAVTLGDEMIFIGNGCKNDGNVYYVDIEFGVFKLNETVTEFMSNLK